MQSPMDPERGLGVPKEDENQPWYVKYGIRALGTCAGGLALLLGALSVIFSIFSPVCMLFSIWQMLVGFVVVTIEAPFCCAFVDHVQVITRKIEDKPLFIKAAIYVLAPLPTIIFCFGFYSFIGGGAVIGVGVMTGMMALGKKASRSEMAAAAMAQNGPGYSDSSNTYQPNQTTQPEKSFLSNIMRDPVQAAAAQWASQSTPANRPQAYEPPPSYSSSVTNNQRTDWDQTFVAENPPNRPPPPQTSYGVNPVSSDPHNPFQ